MARMIPNEDIHEGGLDRLAVGILGYGNQGRAQALNLRDSGVDLYIGQRPGPRADLAASDLMRVLSIPEVASRCDVVMFTLPDESQGDIYASQIAASEERSEKTLLFSHGFSIHFGLIKPAAHTAVALVAPKGQARAVRGRYLEGSGVPGLIAIDQDPRGDAWDIAVGYAAAAGYTRTALLETTFEEEAETDLFGEQAVLCGGMIELMKAGFDVLIDAGYSPEMAYFECVHETKLIIDLVVERGLASMREGISDTAEWGGYLAGPRLVTQETKSEMRNILSEIQSGSFARKWVEEARSGKPALRKLRYEQADSLIERVGKGLRDVINR